MAIWCVDFCTKTSDALEASHLNKMSPLQTSGCLWCGQVEKPNAYVLPLKNGQRKFCSENCLFEFRKAACPVCGDAIIGPPVKFTNGVVVKDFCSEKCLLKYKKKDSSKEAKSPVVGLLKTQPSSLGTSLPSPTSVPASAVTPSLSAGLFSWEEYLAETGTTAAPQKCFKQVRMCLITWTVSLARL